MSKPLHPELVKLAVAHSEQLAFAQKALTPKYFEQLFCSYRQLFWFHMSFFIFAVVCSILLCILFFDRLELILTLTLNCFIFGGILWLMVGQFAAGKLWHRYSRWYCNGRRMEDLYDLFP